MMDTQWPPYIVLDQPGKGKPTFYAGAVHAPDPEMALLNARDVFGRRDSHTQLSVVREDKIFARTAEELADGDATEIPTSSKSSHRSPSPEPYHVYQKTIHKGTLLHVGDVAASNPDEAMVKALDAYPNPKALVWWVIPVSAVHHTDPAENDSLFGPALEKPYRHSSYYPTVTLMREISLANDKLDWRDEEISA